MLRKNGPGRATAATGITSGTSPSGNFRTSAGRYVYKAYDGPVYLYGSNKKINSSNREVGKLAFLNDIDPREYRKRKGNAI